MMVDIMGKNVGVGRNDPALDKARAIVGRQEDARV